MQTKASVPYGCRFVWMPAVVLCLMGVTLGWGTPAVADIYAGDEAGGDMTVLSGGVITINTAATPPTMTWSGGGPKNGDEDGGVAVFRFRNVSVASGVTVTVTGNRPLSIAASRDMYWGAAAIDVSAGKCGGGGGGTGAAGGAVGGTGAGAGGSAGGRGTGGAGGLIGGDPSGSYTDACTGGTGWCGNGGTGVAGGNGTAGGSGSQGGQGADGAVGVSSGTFGFGQSASTGSVGGPGIKGLGSAGGAGSTSPGAGGTGAGGGGAGGTVACAWQEGSYNATTNNGSGVQGTDGAVGGSATAAGSVGLTGGVGGTGGAASNANVPANDLNL